MPFPESPSNYQLLISSVDRLIDLADEAMGTMNPSVIVRLRNSSQQFIIQQYGKDHHFNVSYGRIERIDSLYYLNQIKGVLMAIKDDILIVYNMNNVTKDASSNKDDILTGKILSHFYNHTIYNWEAIINLIKFNADYFDFTINDAKRIYDKLLERQMIARIGTEVACITDEGKRLFDNRYKLAAPTENIQLPVSQSPVDSGLVQLKDSADVKVYQKEKKHARDNFTRKTSDTLAKRVGFVCSNPSCRKLTIGAHDRTDKTTGIGQAAHISAAAPGGPRYDASLSADERRHIENGIWLCSNCAALIDKAPDKYTIAILHRWKTDAEEESRSKISSQLGNL